MADKYSIVKSSKPQRPTKLERIAYHEAGHAVVALVLGMPFKEVTIISSPNALGCLIRNEDEIHERLHIAHLRAYHGNHKPSSSDKKIQETKIKISVAGDIAAKKVLFGRNRIDKLEYGIVGCDNWMAHKGAFFYLYEIWKESAIDIGDGKMYERTHPDPLVLKYLKKMRKETEQIVRHYWKEIELLKDALLIKKTLTYEEVKEIVFPGKNILHAGKIRRYRYEKSRFYKAVIFGKE
jgi:hypothetical protein